jgi:L-seryl-tRNA(Ser) seleniumtransferase
LKNNENKKDLNNKKINLLLSKIPSVEIILQDKALKLLIQKHSRKILTQTVRKVISEEKKNARKNGLLYSAQERINKIKKYLEKENRTALCRVILIWNMTLQKAAEEKEEKLSKN